MAQWVDMEAEKNHALSACWCLTKVLFLLKSDFWWKVLPRQNCEWPPNTSNCYRLHRRTGRRRAQRIVGR